MFSSKQNDRPASDYAADLLDPIASEKNSYLLSQTSPERIDYYGYEKVIVKNPEVTIKPMLSVGTPATPGAATLPPEAPSSAALPAANATSEPSTLPLSETSIGGEAGSASVGGALRMGLFGLNLYSARERALAARAEGDRFGEGLAYAAGVASLVPIVGEAFQVVDQGWSGYKAIFQMGAIKGKEWVSEIIQAQSQRDYAARVSGASLIDMFTGPGIGGWR